MAKKPKLRKDGKPDGRSTLNQKGIKKGPFGPSTGVNKDGSPDMRLRKHYEGLAPGGRKPKYDDPQKLWADCVEFFEWVEANPIKNWELVKHQGQARNVETTHRRPLSLRGLTVFLGITTETWLQYSKKDKFFEVTSRVRAIIERDQIEGATAQVYNANIVARLNGLSDKQELKAAIITVLDGDDDL